jgi:hypothetical protein
MALELLFEGLVQLFISRSEAEQEVRLVQLLAQLTV